MSECALGKDAAERPAVNQSGRSYAECQHVGERIKLDADLGRGASRPRNAAVDRIKEDGKPDAEPRQIEEMCRQYRVGERGVIASDRSKHGQKTHRHVTRGEKRRDNVKPFLYSAVRRLCLFVCHNK